MSVVLTEIAIMMEVVMVSFVQWIERAIQRVNNNLFEHTMVYWHPVKNKAYLFMCYLRDGYSEV